MSTVEGFIYFLTIVDDHTRVTWVYLIFTKDEVLTVFPEFIHMVETQYKAIVKAVRSDNAPELKFVDLYKKKGIEAYHSCPETPEQNSRMERKHQHIFNVARALMFQSHIPLEFWGDYILTAVFTINRLLTPLLKEKSPYQVYTLKKVDYDGLKVFGCLAYCSTSPKIETNFSLVLKRVCFWDIIQATCWGQKRLRRSQRPNLCKMQVCLSATNRARSRKRHNVCSQDKASFEFYLDQT